MSKMLPWNIPIFSVTLLMFSCEKSIQSRLSVPFLEKEIKVDGVIDEVGWEQAVLIENLISPSNKDDSDTTKFRAFVTSNYFNFCFHVGDNTLIAVPFENELSVASEDRVELFFSIDTTLAKYYFIEIDPKGNILDFQLSIIAILMKTGILQVKR